MTNTRALVLGALISGAIAQAGFADSGQGHGVKTDAGSTSGADLQSGASQMGMMGNDHHKMMRAMMKGHGASMMGGEAGQMSMMDRDMMAMMMPKAGQDNIGKEMTAKMQEFDADGDGSLTLDEFEGVHTSAMRERMVDRFQHLDADGDGKITETEIGDAGKRMSAMKNNAGGAGMDGNHKGGNK